MAQIPNGRFVKSRYKPICRDCAMYFSITVWLRMRVPNIGCLRISWVHRSDKFLGRFHKGPQETLGKFDVHLWNEETADVLIFLHDRFRQSGLVYHPSCHQQPLWEGEEVGCHLVVGREWWTWRHETETRNHHIMMSFLNNDYKKNIG